MKENFIKEIDNLNNPSYNDIQLIINQLPDCYAKGYFKAIVDNSRGLNFNEVQAYLGSIARVHNIWR